MTVIHLVPLIICVIFFVTQPVQGAANLSFACVNGYITDIIGVDKEDVVVFDGSQYCHFNETGCEWQNKTTLTVLYVQGEKTSNIAGGKNAHFYDLECKTLGDFIASVSKKVQIATPDPTGMITVKATSTKEISLSISDKNGKEATNVKIGEELFLKITGPENYRVEPLNCTAKSDEQQAEEYPLWENGICSSTDTAIVDGNWTEDSNTISVRMYGFRFIKSKTVLITCSAHFCPKANTACYQKSCLIKTNGVARKRRHADNVETEYEDGYTEDSISTFFTVVDGRVDSSASSGPIVSVIMCITTVALLLSFV